MTIESRESLGDRDPAGVAVDRGVEVAKRLGVAVVGEQLLDGRAGQPERAADLAVEGDRSDAVESRQLADRLGVEVAAKLAGNQLRSLRVERGGQQVGAVGGDRVARGGGQPLGARTPNFATCSSSAASVPDDAPS